nr:nuclear transport factor 2 family protein [Aquimarina sp. RZ0]
MKKFNQAFRTGDVKKIKTMITDSYIHTNGHSKSIDKESWVSYLQNRKTDIDSGHLLVNDYRIDEIEIKIYKVTAIVTARVKVMQTKSGISEENNYRVTNIWVKESGTWKRAGFQDTKIN